jgi:hypothetical protein
MRHFNDHSSHVRLAMIQISRGAGTSKCGGDISVVAVEGNAYLNAELVAGFDPVQLRTHADTFPERRGPVVAKRVGVDRRRGKAAAERSAESRIA